MKFFKFLFSICFIFSFLFSFPALSLENEVVFKLLTRKKKPQPETKRKDPTPLKFRRQSFSYSKDFVIYNEPPKSNLRPGTALTVNIPYPVIASFNEEFPVYGVVISPFPGIVSGKVKGVKSTNTAQVLFDEIIIGGKARKIESFPVFIEGDLKEALLKDIFLNFFESLPSVLSLALKSQIPQSGIQFINTDLQNKMGKFSFLETEKRKRLEYLELKDIELFKVVIR